MEPSAGCLGGLRETSIAKDVRFQLSASREQEMQPSDLQVVPGERARGQETE